MEFVAPCRVSAEASDRFVVFDAISSSVRFQKPVADGWMKVSSPSPTITCR